MRDVFQGFSQFDAAPDDEQRLKWNVLRKHFGFQPVDLSPIVGLAEFNAKVNRAVRWTAPNEKDDWKIPEQTWKDGTGDCMDIAALKYSALLGLYPERALAVVIGEIAAMPKPEGHAWLLVETETGQRAILDSKSDPLIKPSRPPSFSVSGVDADYINWRPNKMFSGDEVQRFGRLVVIEATELRRT